MSGGAAVFLGPTLRQAEAIGLVPGAVMLPPARQGDVFRAIQQHDPASIALIDGAFLDVPAVWHREILWALERGVAVVGAASMGALRAAELHGFGMRGEGQVFEAYRDGVLPGWDEAFEDDDEVAVIHAPGELGFAPLSDAMVDLRATLARAEQAGIVDRAARDRLAAVLKRRHFPARTLAVLTESARDCGETALAEWLPAEHRSLKAEDARRALGVVAAGLLPPPRMFHREPALVWERFVAAQARDGEVAEPQARRALDRLRQDEAAYRSVFLQAMGRLAVRDAVSPATADPAGLDRFRTRRGLWTRAALDDWMAANGTDAAGLVRLLGEDTGIDAALARPSLAVRYAMLDVLRLCGEYAGTGRGSSALEERDEVPPLSAVE